MALKPCDECGEQISDRAEECPHCGTPTASVECWECGGMVRRNADTCPNCGVPDPAPKEPTPSVRKVKSYYRRQFRKFDENGGNWTFTWNWPAFLFGVFWYFYRGMWAKALILTAFTLLSGGALFIFVWGYCGAVGNYDYYLLVEEGTQLYPSVA